LVRKKKKIVSPNSGLPILRKEGKTKETKLKISSVSKYERKQKNKIELSPVSAKSSKKGSSGK
jgi:hypothetical protein